MTTDRSTGVRGRMKPMSAEVLLRTPSKVMPSLSLSAAPASRYMPYTPIEPVSVIRSATITSAGQEI